MGYPGQSPQTLKGAVERFNYSPKERYESIVLKSGDKLIQVNFPKPMTAEVIKAVATGDQVTVVGVLVKRSIGEKLSVEGAVVTMADGHFVMEGPSAVNSIKMP